jgi:hypothetical protein
MEHFSVHWAPIPQSQAQQLATAGTQLFALWPAPVNYDACFTAAGFTIFEDNDTEWDTQADALLERLLAQLEATYGAPQLCSPPSSHHVAWYVRPFRKPQQLRLIQQIMLPIAWDSLPDCVVAFGGRARLICGNGHHMFWLILPETDVPQMETWLADICAGVPCVRTDLQWRHLLARHH